MQTIYIVLIGLVFELLSDHSSSLMLPLLTVLPFESLSTIRVWDCDNDNVAALRGLLVSTDPSGFSTGGVRIGATRAEFFGCIGFDRIEST